MNKKFIAEVLKLAPEFAVVNGYFYVEPVDHILCGFVCERPPSGAYIWKYAFPLYDRCKRLHLGFGDRLPLPDCFMEAKRGREKEVAAEFIRRIQPYRSEIASLACLDRFAAYIETEIGLENPIIRRGYAVTLIMLGRANEAMAELAALASLDAVKEDQEFSADITRLQSDLSIGIETARKTLGAWEQETKQRLALIPA